MKRSLKTLAVVLATAAAALTLSTTALAAFAAHDRAPAGGWNVSLGASSWSDSLSALYPGAAGDTEILPFKITNARFERRVLRSITASIRTEPDGDAETVAGAEIRGCLAQWFTVSSGPSALPSVLASGATYSGDFEIRMVDSGSDQSACEGVTPAVELTPA